MGGRDTHPGRPGYISIFFQLFEDGINKDISPWIVVAFALMQESMFILLS